MVLSSRAWYWGWCCGVVVIVECAVLALLPRRSVLLLLLLPACTVLAGPPCCCCCDLLRTISHVLSGAENENEKLLSAQHEVSTECACQPSTEQRSTEHYYAAQPCLTSPLFSSLLPTFLVCPLPLSRAAFAVWTARIAHCVARGRVGRRRWQRWPGRRRWRRGTTDQP